MRKIVFIIGQSGSGKTVLVNYFNGHPIKGWRTFDFDVGGIKKPDQKDISKLAEWVKKQREFWIKEVQSNKYGDTNIALLGVGMFPWKTNLVGNNIHYGYLDCDQEIRKQRLIDRGDQHLWEVYQNDITEIVKRLDKAGAKKFDTSSSSVEKTAQEIKEWLYSL